MLRKPVVVSDEGAGAYSERIISQLRSNTEHDEYWAAITLDAV